MRILYVVSYYKPAYVYGGSVTAVSTLCEALTQSGADLTVLTTNANGQQRLEVPLNQPVNVDGVEVYYYPVTSMPPRSFFHSPQLATACKRMISQFDVAILDIFWTHAMGPVVNAGNREKVPCIVPLHGQLMPWAMHHKWLKKYINFRLFGRRYLNLATAVHCASQIEANALTRLGVGTYPIVMPYGINVDEFARLPAPGSLRCKLGIPHDAYLLLVLGRLHRVKNPDVVVEALAQLQRRDTHVVYAGPDEEGLQAILTARSEQLGCEQQVHFSGLLSRSEVLQVLVDADLLVMPSAMESFGMAAVEALAAGVPVLLSDKVPIGQWVQQAGVGVIVPATASQLAQALTNLLTKPDELKAMGRRGQRLVYERFGIENIAREMTAQLKAIIATGRPLP